MAGPRPGYRSPRTPNDLEKSIQPRMGVWDRLCPRVAKVLPASSPTPRTPTRAQERGYPKAANPLFLGLDHYTPAALQRPALAGSPRTLLERPLHHLQLDHCPADGPKLYSSAATLPPYRR